METKKIQCYIRNSDDHKITECIYKNGMLRFDLTSGEMQSFGFNPLTKAASQR